MSPLIELKDVSYRYPTAEMRAREEGGRLWALQEINLSVEQGEFVAIMGRNGSGKTTLCLTFNGLVPHFFKGVMKGEVRVGEVKTADVDVTELISQVGIVFQNPFDQLTAATDTVYAEVAFGPENLGLTREEIMARVEEAMKRTRTSELRDRNPFQLSGGQQQRVAIASMLSMRPGILVLDEPTSQLDPIGTDEVLETVKEMHREGATILMAEHKVEYVAELADRVVVLQEGKIVLQGTPREVLTNPELERYGVQAPYFTTLGRELAEQGILEGSPPVTLEEAISGLKEVFR